MKLIERDLYLNKLISLAGSPDIKIITGIRRSGKSRLMQSFASYVKRTDPRANLIIIDFTRLSFEPLQEYHALHRYVEEHTIPDVPNYLMIDEVQMCPNFEIAINSLHACELYDIYLTGSNAFMLSADLATLFTGRHIEISVYPFSFKEYCKYFEIDDDLQTAFDKYVVEGGMSGSYVYPSPIDKENYVREVFNTILTRDLTEKYRLSDTHVLSQLAEYLIDNVSNTTSPNNVANVLSANQTPTTHVTIAKYIKMLCHAFVFYKIGRYDIRGKKYLESQNKYYLADTGFRYALLGRRNMDWGRMYENIVCLELMRRGYNVYIGKLYQKEVDFVAMKGNEKIYIQVSDDISSETTLDRELSPLTAIKDSYPKILLARTRHEEYDIQGIRVIDLARWLSQTVAPHPQ